MKHLKVIVTLHNSMQYCQYLCIHTAISLGQKKWHEKLRKKCEIGFCDQLLKLQQLRTLYTSDKISWKNTCSVVFRLKQYKKKNISQVTIISRLAKWNLLTLRNKINRNQQKDVCLPNSQHFHDEKQQKLTRLTEYLLRGLTRPVSRLR